MLQASAAANRVRPRCEGPGHGELCRRGEGGDPVSSRPLRQTTACSSVKASQMAAQTEERPGKIEHGAGFGSPAPEFAHAEIGQAGQHAGPRPSRPRSRSAWKVKLEQDDDAHQTKTSAPACRR